MSTPTRPFEIEVDAAGHGRVAVDGHDLGGVERVILEADGLGNVPRLIVEYACFDAIAAGEAQVVHYCPRGDDEAEQRRRLETIAKAARAFAEAAGPGGRLLPQGFTLGQSLALRELLNLARPTAATDDEEESR